jgi:L-threonylcarbamoyladenylate synthase
MSEVLRIAEDGDEAAREALEACINAGGVAVFPADGLYGLACDPMSPAAIRRIHELKGRPARKPSAVLYFDQLAMRELVAEMGPRTREAAAALLPGPVTLVIHNSAHRYPLACADDPEKLGIRLLEGPLRGARFPLFQTSANLSGEPPPASFREVDVEMIKAVDLAIDGGQLTGEPSTVIDVSRIERSGEWEVLREGGLAKAEVERLLNPTPN